MKPLKWRKTNAQTYSLLFGRRKIRIETNWRLEDWEIRAFGKVWLRPDPDYIWGKPFNTVAEAMDFVDFNFDKIVAPVKAAAERKVHDLGEAQRLFGLYCIDRSVLKEEV